MCKTILFFSIVLMASAEMYYIKDRPERRRFLQQQQKDSIIPKARTQTMCRVMNTFFRFLFMSGAEFGSTAYGTACNINKQFTKNVSIYKAKQGKKGKIL